MCGGDHHPWLGTQKKREQNKNHGGNHEEALKQLLESTPPGWKEHMLEKILDKVDLLQDPTSLKLMKKIQKKLLHMHLSSPHAAHSYNNM